MALTERPARTLPGLAMLGIAVLFGLAAILALALGELDVNPALVALLFIVSAFIAFHALIGLTVVAPGQARVLQFLGRYTGTVREPGLQWVFPYTTRRKVSTRIRNHETRTTKVNDKDGNPIEMAAVVVWQVADTAAALFEVENFEEFVAIQTDTAVRHIAGQYPYDSHGEGELSLRDNADEITERLATEIGERVIAAGVRVIESRLTHLAYAPEIAQAMLRRQQANAVVAARQRIVEGAVGMVELALNKLAENDVVELDEERKAAMVSNLLVVLCGDRDTQPVVNTGSLYA
jgi:regulator of protease activity HflC (stomatin/prohibitin superfamily)